MDAARRATSTRRGSATMRARWAWSPRAAGASSWRRLQLLLTVAACIAMAAAASEVTTQGELQSAIDAGESDIIVMGLIRIKAGAITIDDAKTDFVIRGGTVDAGFEGLETEGQGLFDIQAGASVTFAGLSFSKGYNSDDGGCVAITGGSTVVFDDAHFSACTAGVASFFCLCFLKRIAPRQQTRIISTRQCACLLTCTTAL